MVAGHPQTFNFPSVVDTEGNPIYVSCLCNGVSCPSYINNTKTQLTIAPAGTQAAYSTPFTITVSDTNLFTDYTVTIDIIENQPPVLNPSTLPGNVGAGSS